MNRKLLIVIAIVILIVVALLSIKIFFPENNFIDKGINWISGTDQSNQSQSIFKINQDDVKMRTSDGSIKLTSPAPNSKVKPGFVVSGTARVAENTVSWKLISSDNKILGQGNVSVEVNEEINVSLFDFQVIYPEETTGSGFLEIFDYTLKDGSLYEKIQIPLSFN